MQSTSRSYENVFEELVDSLNRTSASIEDALNRLKTAYDARLQLDQFTAQARHRLFCELRLYGENVYPVTLDFITRTKTAFDTLSHVENISQLKAILPHIVPDCEELLLIENSLSNKYGKILENMQNIKESLSINMAGTLSASLADCHESLTLGTHAPTPSSSESSPFHWLWELLLSLWPGATGSVSTRTRESEVLTIVVDCIEGAMSSILLMSHVLRTLKSLLRQMIVTAKGNGKLDENELVLLLRNAHLVASALSNLISTRNIQERVMFSIGDRVEDSYSREWLGNLDK